MTVGRSPTTTPPADVEAELAGLAADGMSPEDLRATIKQRQRAARADAMHRDERRQHARRSASITRRDDGMWRLHALLDDETGTRWTLDLDPTTAIATWISPTGTTTQTRPPPG